MEKIEKFDTLLSLMNSIRGHNNGSKKPLRTPTTIVATGAFMGRKTEYKAFHEQSENSVGGVNSINSPTLFSANIDYLPENLRINTKCRPICSLKTLKLEK